MTHAHLELSLGLGAFKFLTSSELSAFLFNLSATFGAKTTQLLAIQLLRKDSGKNSRCGLQLSANQKCMIHDIVAVWMFGQST